MKSILYPFLIFLLSVNCLTAQSQKIDSLAQVIKNTSDPSEKGEAYALLLEEKIGEGSDDYLESYRAAIAFAAESSQKELSYKYAILNLKREKKLRNTTAVFKQADSLLAIIGEDNLLPTRLEILSIKGATYGDIPDYAAAAAAFFDKMELLKKYSEDPNEFARGYHGLGWALMNSKNYNKALEYFNTSLEYQKQFDTPFRPNTYWNMGICYMEQNDFEPALKILNLGVEEALRTNNADAAAGNQTCIASVYVRQDKFEKGLEAYQKAYQMALDAKQPPFKVIEALNGIIYSYNQLAQPFEAVPYIQIADSLIEANDYSEIRTRQFLFQKTNNLLQRGLPQEADEVFIKYERAYDSIRERRNQASIQEKETLFRTKEKEQELLLRDEELKNQRVISIALSAGVLLLGLIGFLLIRQQRHKISLQKQEQKLKEALHKVETKNKLEEQRHRISKELHDNIGSQLTYISSSAQNIGLALKLNKGASVQKRIDQLSEFSTEAIADLRDTVWVMNYTTVSWETLKERVIYLAHKVTTATDIKMEVELIGTSEQLLKPEDTLNIFRIIQESVNNSVKHAQATLITVKLIVSPEVQIEISDNGKGYDTASVTNASSGLQSMKSRAHRLSGELLVDTSSEGTKVLLKLPFNGTDVS